MSDKEGGDSENWKKSILTGVQGGASSSRQEENPDDTEKWEEACNKVFRTEQFTIEKLANPLDVAQVDERARAYRRGSVADDPIPAWERSSSVVSSSHDDHRKVRTVLPGEDAGEHGEGHGLTRRASESRAPGPSVLPRRINTVSGNLSEYSVHTEEGFPRIHHVMSRKLHRIESRDDSDPSATPSSPPSVRAGIPIRNRKISTGPGLQTIRDEDTTGLSDEEEARRAVEAVMTATSHGETESESEVERLPWHIGRRPSQFSVISDDYEADARHHPDDDDTDPERLVGSAKVKFGQPETETETEDAEPSAHATERPIDRKKHKKKKYHSHRRRSHFTEEELRNRRARGSDLRQVDRHDVDTEEDLENRDIAAIASHRMDPLSGLSIHKISRAASIAPTSHSDFHRNMSIIPGDMPPLMEADTTPHELFVEMDELRGHEWQEVARWIKFEEDLLEGAERWGKPHVPSLTFHSVINLRLVLEKCVLLFDFEARDFHSVVYRLVEEFGINDDLSPEVKSEVLRTLLLPHRYVDGHTSNFKLSEFRRSLSRASLRGSVKGFSGEEGHGHSHGHHLSHLGHLGHRGHHGHHGHGHEHRIKWLRQFSKQSSSPNLETQAQLQSLLHGDEKFSSPNIMSMKDGRSKSVEKDSDKLVTVEMGDDVSTGGASLQPSQSFSELYKLATAQRRDNIMSKLEAGTEGTMSLVGALDSLKRPLVGLVRLSHGVIMPNLMEIPLPVRFIFVLFTPRISPNMDFHEVGRSFSTLMSNKKFQNVCYVIEERQELLNSINNFLDETVVLPPGDWDKKTLLSMSEIHELKRKKRARLAAMERLKQEREVLKQISELEPEKKDVLIAEKVLEVVKAAEQAQEKKPPVRTDDPLVRTNVPFGGLINELKKRYPLYKSDIVDAFSPMCLAAIIFIFFAAISGAIAFGGLYDDKTDGFIGIPETLIVSCVSGCLFALFSGQPIVIVGVTGPVMVYDQALFQFSKSAEVEFLPWRVWISFWALIIALLVAAFQGSFIVKFFSRFTKDIFAAFIATVFIYEALLKTAGFFNSHPTLQLVEYCTKPDISAFLLNFTSPMSLDNEEELIIEDENTTTTLFDNVTSEAGTSFPTFEVEPNTAFKSFILQFCTFWIAYYLRIFRNGKALGRTIRRALGDFGVPIAIVIMVAVDMAFPSVFTQKLNVPQGLDVTAPEKRGWFISPMGLHEAVPIWIPFISVLPAILLYMLLFMETSICELILMDKCKKGSGLHWDVVLLCILNVPGALFGGPWICAATVRAIAHLSALTVMSTTHKPGESPKVVDVKDQRVTAFCVALLVGMSVLLSPLLRLVPNSVIFGVFLYMGISSLNGIQFFDRLWLMFMPVKHHPNISYCRRVRTWKMHLYTICQGAGLAILWIVKSTPAALVFPFFVVFMIPLRLSLKFIFTPRELDALDGPNAGQFVHEDDEQEPDFYAQGIGG